MLRGRKTGVAAVFTIAAVAAVTAGCGGGGSALALDPVAAAATKSQNAGAAHIRFSLTLSAPQLQSKMLRIRGTGAIDGTSGEMTVAVRSPCVATNGASATARWPMLEPCTKVSCVRSIRLSSTSR